jgi:restriction-modification enzyme MmeI-like protein
LSATDVLTPEAFVERWEGTGAQERANYVSFLKELCDVLEVPHPDPAGPDDELNAYVFERAVTFQNGDGTTSTGRIDLYRRGCFVLEAKQGSDRPEAADGDGRGRKLRRGTATRGTRGWDVAMLSARGQAEQYARALPVSEGWPPFLVVVDVGYSIELYSDFSRSGKTYIPFPDPRSHRLFLRDLLKEDVRERLRRIWTDPLSLDPSRRSARITREVAAKLGALAKSLEESGHAPERAASFLMRCIFTMFAEDVQLIREGGFTGLLESLRGEAALFLDMARSLWETMNAGGFSPILRQHLLRFNGGLFETADALPLTEGQLDLLIEASQADWKDVEPAIFGTLLERALDPVERHKLGAHYTPRAYVERLVMPTIVEPLRDEWATVQAAALTARRAGGTEGAAEVVRAFHRKLCTVRVLDPACGSGNFLYVTLEHLKRLEGEVLDLLNGLGQMTLDYEEQGLAVDPHQLLGIEVNPRAAAITDLVLWIGYLQWHFRTRGQTLPAQPVIKKFHNIECRDAVLAYDGVEPVLDESGQPVTVWDRRTCKKHPITGEDVPDDMARVPLYRYVNPHKAEWPKADYVVGNPPFVGKLYLLTSLGEGYVEALRQTYQGAVPDGADYVMYWWYRAAHLAATGQIRRFGLISTNSITMAFSRRVVSQALEGANPVRLAFAVPDHPWVDTAESAAVRIAMTVGEAGIGDGTLATVVREVERIGEDFVVDLSTRTGQVHADLRMGANVASAVPLRANSLLASTGLILGSRGFVLTSDEAEDLRRRESAAQSLIFPIRNGRDITDVCRNAFVIDTQGWTEENLRTEAPAIYQRLLERVYPERQTNRDPRLRAHWWLFRRSNEQVRTAIADLPRYIATVETAKHRVFLFLGHDVKPEHKLVVIGSGDAFFLGVLSSRLHVIWALAAGGTLEDRPVYTKTVCFDSFPFPDCTEEQKARIRELGEALDAHRKRQQAQHPKLTMTDMYNVLEKLRAGEPLTEREKATHEQGLVSVLKQIHDDLDAAVFAAYGWPATLTDEEILERVVALNAERAAEERRGLVRWLRPEFQNPAGAGQTTMETDEQAAVPAAAAKGEKVLWPRSLPDQARAVREALAAQAGVVTPRDLAGAFRGARVDRVEALLSTLASLGQARKVEPGRFAA